MKDRLIVVIAIAALLLAIYPMTGIGSIVGLAGGGNPTVQRSVIEGGSLAIRSSLYANGHPTGVSGAVREAAVWQNFMYVSFVGSNGDFLLDAWNISDRSAPKYIRSYSYGNIFDDVNRLIPQAHLQGPRDLAARDGMLFVWSSERLLVYPILESGSLGEVTATSIADGLNPTLGRLQYGGDYRFASVKRRLLSDREFSQRIGTMPQRELEKLLESEVVISLQDPKHPYVVAAKNLHGLGYQKIGQALSGSFRGLPAAISIREDRKELTLLTSSIERLGHYEGFWKKQSEAIFNPQKRGALFRELVADALQSSGLSALIQEINTEALQIIGIEANRSLPDLVQRKFKGKVTLKDMFKKLRIKPTDSLRTIIQTYIGSRIPITIAGNYEKQIHDRFGKGLSETVLVNPHLDIGSLQASYESAMNAALDTDGLERYILSKVLGPLIGNPDYLSFTLRQLIDSVSQSPLGRAINTPLQLFHETMRPLGPVLRAFRFVAPCFEVPQSSSDLLNIMIVRNGPQLNIDGLAFFEMLKLIEFYSGSSNYSRLMREIESHVRTLHRDLGINLISNLSILPQDTFAFPSISAMWTSYLSNFSVDISLREAFVDAIVVQLTNLGLKADVPLNIELQRFGLYIDKKDIPKKKIKTKKVSTVKDLLSVMNRKLRLANVTFQSAIEIAADAGVDALAPQLEQPSRELLRDLFGTLPDDTVFEDAVSQFLLVRVPADPMATFSKSVMDEVLQNLNNNVRFPGIIGTLQLAAQGECLAQWQLALDGVSTFAGGSFVFSGAVAPLQIAKTALLDAADAMVHYISRTLLTKFLEEIFGDRAGNFPSFQLGLSLDEQSFDLERLAERAAEQVNGSVSQDKLAVFMRDMGQSFPSRTGNDLLTMVVSNPFSLNSKSIFEIGSWDTLNTVLSSEGQTFLAGNAKIGARILPSIRVVDWSTNNVAQYTLTSDTASRFSASKQFLRLMGSNAYAVVTQVGIEILDR